MSNPEQTNKSVDDTSKPTGSDVSKENKPVEVDYEKRYKDTQGAFTKSQQELKAMKARNKILEELTVPKVELDEATKTELEKLKFSDPEAWRNRLNTLETEAHTAHRATLNEAENQVNKQTELEARDAIFATFQASHPDLNITDDVIKYDVPPRITAKLESGEIGFEQYLSDVAEYLGAPKVIGDGNKVNGQPNLADVGGDNTPTKDAVKKDIVKDYKNIVF